MGQLIISLFIAIPLFLTDTPQTIEKAFLQNNPKLLISLFSTRNRVSISLPAPLVFSDQLSAQQTYFLLKDIFSTYSTFEFYSEPAPSAVSEKTMILRARWSFRHKRNKDQYVFHVFFLLVPEEHNRDMNPSPQWKITEIKAQTL